MIDANVGFNTCLSNLKSSLVNDINESGLPVGIVYYIVKDLFTEIATAYESTLKNEKVASEQIKVEQESTETKSDKSKK